MRTRRVLLVGGCNRNITLTRIRIRTINRKCNPNDRRRERGSCTDRQVVQAILMLQVAARLTRLTHLWVLVELRLHRG